MYKQNNSIEYQSTCTTAIDIMSNSPFILQGNLKGESKVYWELFWVFSRTASNALKIKSSGDP